MTITVFPADAVSGSPTYSGRMLREALGALSAGATSSRPLGGHSGIRPGTGTCVTATSTTWTITPHAGMLDLEAANEAGTYLYAINTNQTGSMTAADGTNSRVDIVYLTLNDPAESDGTATPGVVTGYLAGPANGSNTPPATPARSMVLAQISVPKSGSGSPSVTMVAPYAVAAGAPIPVGSLTERNSLATYNGLSVWRQDMSVVETWDSVNSRWLSGFHAYTPTLYNNTSTTPVAISTSFYTVNTAAYRIDDQGMVTVVYDIHLNAATAGGVSVSLPVSVPSGYQFCTGVAVMIGASAPSTQSGMAFVTASLNKVAMSSYTGSGYLDSPNTNDLYLRANLSYPTRIIT